MTIISIISAIVLLIGAVIVLYFVTNPKAQLTILCGWTAFFALTLGLLTNARRQDVFVATAAYAAVLVVFVSGNLASQANSSRSSNSTVSTATVSATSTITSIITTALSSSTATTSAPVANATGQSSTSGLSTQDKIGLGVGIGVGVPAVAIASLLTMYCNKKRVLAYLIG